MAFLNFFASKISNDIGAADTSIVVDTAPTATSGRFVLEARNPTQREIIKYTGVSGNTLTGVTRGQGGTTAKAHVKGSLIEMNLTAEDVQDLYDAFQSFAASNNDWRSLVPTVSSVTDLGNRSVQVVFNTSVASILSPGMRARFTRNTAAPTQSTLLNGTNQYYSKTSPTGVTSTDDFVTGAWIKLSSYALGGIITRTDNTSGWVLRVNTDGTIEMFGLNAGGSNFSSVKSYRSIPLNKWVHVAAQLDMSAFTTTPTTSYVMIDGVDVPAVVSRGGTNPTALVQAGDLEVGRGGTAGTYFPGKIAQAFVTSAKLTQSQVLAIKNQGITTANTTTYSMAAAYSFNNSLNDINTTNANNLTAQNGAVATNADSPFGNQGDGTISNQYDYGIVQSVSGTTAIFQMAEGCTVPTLGTVSAVAYASVKVPYNFPDQADKWTLSFVCAMDATKTGATPGAWYGDTNLGATAVGYRIPIPTGSWNFYAKLLAHSASAGAAFQGVQLAYSTSTTAPTDERLNSYGQGGPNLTLLRPTLTLSAPITVSTMTTYYLLALTSNGTEAGIFGGLAAKNTIEVTNAYL